MFKPALIAGGVALAALALPVIAQTPPAMMTADQVGASPMTGTDAATYVKLAGDGDMFEIQSAKVALMKSKNPQIRSFAQEMIKDHTTSTKTLKAALKNNDRTLAPPPMMLNSDSAAMLAQLKKTPKATFDQIYVQQQLQSHQKAWSLHEGYATDGTDPALKQVATTVVPVVEHHLGELKAMPGAPASTAM